MSLGRTLFTLAMLLQPLVLLGVLVVVAKAVVAYRQHDSRPMLLLAVGLTLLLVAPVALEVLAEAVVPGLGPAGPDGPARDVWLELGAFHLVEQLLRLGGVAAILASLYVEE